MTPETIHYLDAQGVEHELPPSGQLIRVRRTPRGPSPTDTGDVDVWRRDSVEILGIPEVPKREIRYIVTREVADAIHLSSYPLIRYDLLTPGLDPHDNPHIDKRTGRCIVRRFKLVF